MNTIAPTTRRVNLASVHTGVVSDLAGIASGGIRLSALDTRTPLGTLDLGRRARHHNPTGQGRGLGLRALRLGARVILVGMPGRIRRQFGRFKVGQRPRGSRFPSR